MSSSAKAGLQPGAARQALRQQPWPPEVQRWWQIAFQPHSSYSVSPPEQQFRRGRQNGYDVLPCTPAAISSAHSGGHQ